MVGSASGQKQSVKFRHTLSVYISLGRGEGRKGGEVREKIEGQQDTSIVPSSMGVTNWIENTNQ